MFRLFSCFSGSRKVTFEGNQREADHDVDGDHKTKSKKSRTSFAIPVSYFPTGVNLSRL